MKSLSLVVIAAALATLAGCAAESNSSADSASTSDADMIISTVKLSGAYHASEGSTADGIKGIVFNKDGHFFADIDTGVRCITTPCDDTARLSGTYMISGHSVILSPVANATNEFYGRYDVVIADTGVVSFTHSGEGVAPLTATLEPAASYCAAVADCGSQNLIHPMCAPGGWSCNAASACAFKCGN